MHDTVGHRLTDSDFSSEDQFTDKRPRIVYFRADLATYITPEMRNRLCQNQEWSVLLCVTWDDILDALRYRPALITIHHGMTNLANKITIYEVVASIRVLCQAVNPEIQTKIAIGVDSSVQMQNIKNFKKIGVSGVVPTVESFGIDATYHGIKAILETGEHWPIALFKSTDKSIIKLPSKYTTLTGRQQEIAKLICVQGCSNKQVAKKLGISESAIKSQMTSILKKFHVRNRTQLCAVYEKSIGALSKSIMY